MGIMKDLDIELHNAPNLIKYLEHRINMLEERMNKIEA